MRTLLHESALSSPIGPLLLLSTDSGLCALGLGPGSGRRLRPWARRVFPDADVAAAGERHAVFAGQILEYLEGRRRVFDLPLDLRGTDFQKKVWSAVIRIPFGQTTSYGEIARLIGRPRAGRAVGAANARNPVPLVVPCHRVIGADGSLAGYGGGLDIKRWLLAHEGVLRVGPFQMGLFPPSG